MDDPRTAHIRALTEPLLTEHAMELVELTCRPQGGQLHVRLLVDRVGGMTIQHCAQMNQLIGQALEAQALIAESDTVEVSSPGLDRPLMNKRDFERAVGEDLQVVLQTERGRITELQGMLLAVQPEAIVMKTPAGNMTIPLTQIGRAKKVLRW